jgi:hypothetical protein
MGASIVHGCVRLVAPMDPEPGVETVCKRPTTRGRCNAPMFTEHARQPPDTRALCHSTDVLVHVCDRSREPRGSNRLKGGALREDEKGVRMAQKMRVGARSPVGNSSLGIPSMEIRNTAIKACSWPNFWANTKSSRPSFRPTWRRGTLPLAAARSPAPCTPPAPSSPRW